MTVVKHYAGPGLATGAVVGVPDPSTMAVAGVRSQAGVRELPTFARIVRDPWSRAVLPCSPEVY